LLPHGDLRLGLPDRDLRGDLIDQDLCTLLTLDRNRHQADDGHNGIGASLRVLALEGLLGLAHPLLNLGTLLRRHLGHLLADVLECGPGVLPGLIEGLAVVALCCLLQAVGRLLQALLGGLKLLVALGLARGSSRLLAGLHLCRLLRQCWSGKHGRHGKSRDEAWAHRCPPSAEDVRMSPVGSI
jgi:hypothetical protein